MNSLDILSLSSSLDNGDSLRTTCPGCDKDGLTLSVTKTEDGTILYQCFRASCDCKGVIRGEGHEYIKQIATVKPKHKVWEGDTTELPPEVRRWVSRKWGIDNPLNWYYTKDYGGRIAMSIRSPNNLHRGWVLRSDGKGPLPKALTYLDDGAIALSWYRCDAPNRPSIIVEDIPSAVRVSKYANAICLIGTACGEDKSLEIRRHAIRPIYVALDQDATRQSVQIQRTNSLLWDGPRVLPLPCDFKDMGQDQLCQILERLSPAT